MILLILLSLLFHQKIDFIIYRFADLNKLFWILLINSIYWLSSASRSVCVKYSVWWIYLNEQFKGQPHSLWGRHLSESLSFSHLKTYLITISIRNNIFLWDGLKMTLFFVLIYHFLGFSPFATLYEYCSGFYLKFKDTFESE